MKVFFVKYNDPIYVKLEKLDIMIRLTNASNIAQVLGELKEYATEVDVDFVRKSVRAIGRCAIKVEQAAEKCVSTLIELIQTKVNYVVQEAIVVIKDIFRKYPNRYENIISTLCENLDSLDEPEARASMIWIIGEYAERIDNADELLQSFLDGFQDENALVQLQLLTAIVKLFLKKPTETQELVQNVLTLTTQDTDNPDLRDRGYIYWRLLSTDAAAAKEVVLSEKPLISEETDLLEPTLLDELICHISSLASVYHKPPNAFVEGKVGVRRALPAKSGGVGSGGANEDGDDEDESVGHHHQYVSGGVGTGSKQPTIIPTSDLLGDLLDIGGFTPQPIQQSTYSSAYPVQNSAGFDLLGDGLDSLIGGGGGELSAGPAGGMITSLNMGAGTPTANMNLTQQPTNLGGLAEIFSGLGMSSTATASSLVPAKQCWLPAQKGKGLEINGTFTRRSGAINVDLEFVNKALQPMHGFAIQLNKNSFGLTIINQLQISMLQPNQASVTTMVLNTNGPVQKMQPINNLQIAVKNNIDVSYFSALVPMHVYFAEDGEIDKRLFLNTWKEIPEQNEMQFQINLASAFINSDELCNKLRNNNVFTIAKRNVEGQDMLYQSIKLTNGIWILAEVKVTPNNPTLTVKFVFLKLYK